MKNYKLNSIFIKNLRLLIVLVMFPLILLSSLGYMFYNNSLLREINATTLNNLNKTKDSVDSLLEQTNVVLRTITSDQDVESFMFKYYSSLSQGNILNRTLSIDKLIKSFTLPNKYIDSIYLYSKRNNYILSTRGSNYISNFNDSKWFEEYQKNEQSYSDKVFLRKSDYNINREYDFLSFFRNVQPFLDIEGLLILNVDIDEFDKTINRTIDKTYTNFFIIDSADNIVYSNNYNYVNKKITEINLLKNIDYSTIPTTITKTQDENNVVVAIEKSNHNNWRYISVVPIKHYEKNLSYLKNLIIVVTLFGLIISIILSFIISYRIYKPIDNIVSILENPEEWLDLNTRRNLGNLDEYSYIVKNVLNTYASNKQMEEKLIQHVSLIKKAQTIALQSQINPHFLFNTLGVIKQITVGLTKGENNASVMISYLADLFMLVMETKEHLVSIKKEIQHADIYIKLLEIRYKNKFEVKWNIEEIILEHMTIKLSLQPLIENAIYHGIKPIKGIGQIIINGYSKEGCVVFELIDNGVGIPKQLVDSLNKSMAEDYVKENEHIGLCNVNQRIKLIFGQEYGITVESELGHGTKITIIIPLHFS